MNKDMYDRIRLESLTSSPVVDLELHPLINLLLSDTLSWFSEISNDQELFIEILKAFSIILSNIESRCMKIDWVLLLVKDVPELLVAHINDFKRASTMNVVGKNISQIFHGLQPHYGIDDCNEYTRKLADMVINALLSKKECDSDLIRYFLREMLSQVVLAPLLDVISEPDFFYEMFLSGSSRSSSNIPEKNSIIQEKDSKSQSQSILKNEIVDNTDQSENQKSLFTLKESSFRKPASPKGVYGANITNSIVSGFNKLTLKGMDRVSSGIDKLRTTFRGSAKDDDSSTGRARSRFVTPKRRISKEPSSSPDKTLKQGKLSFKMQKGHKKKLSEKLDDFLSSPALPRFFASKGDKSPKPVDAGSDVESGNVSDSAILKPVESNHRRSFSEMVPISNERMTNSPPPTNDIYDTESEASLLDEKSITLTDDTFSPNHASLLQPVDSIFDQMQGEKVHVNEVFQKPQETNSFYEYWKMLLYLYSESSLGPTKIGILDLSRYSGICLEDGLINLINSVFRFSERASWMWTQAIFFMRPLANYFARSTINRYFYVLKSRNIVKAVYHVISPPQVATYLALIRDVVWPNGVRPAIKQEKTADEKVRTKLEAAQRILKIFQGMIYIHS
jgi:hypothetical protein